MSRGNGWEGTRAPLLDEGDEARRTAAYWGWLDSVAADLRDAAPTVADASRGGRWVRLTCPGDADFEAAAMRHSVGHSWDRYSSYGDIFSLRSAEGAPQATVLFSGGEAVHAREQRNARLSGDNMAELEAFAASMGMAVRPEPPFDLLTWDDGAANTRLVYLHRGPGGRKAFGEAVVSGRATDALLADLAAALPGGRGFLPGALGAADLRSSGGDPLHEIMALRHVRDEPTLPMDIEGLRHALLAAAPGFPARLV